MKRLSHYVLILFLILLFRPQISWAVYDWGSQTLGRSYPYGGFVSAHVGNAVKLWDNSNKAKFLYGMVRASLRFQTSAVVNSGIIQLGIYPISILGFYTGTSLSERDYENFDTFDCGQVICSALMTRSWFGIKNALKFKSYFWLFDGRVETIKVNKKNKVFAEEQGTLFGRAGSDELAKLTIISGKELGAFAKGKISAGAMGLHFQMKNFKNRSYYLGPFIKYDRGKWSGLLTMGQFKTRNDGEVFSILGLLKWTGKKGLMLF